MQSIPSAILDVNASKQSVKNWPKKKVSWILSIPWRPLKKLLLTLMKKRKRCNCLRQCGFLQWVCLFYVRHQRISIYTIILYQSYSWMDRTSSRKSSIKSKLIRPANVYVGSLKKLEDDNHENDHSI